MEVATDLPETGPADGAALPQEAEEEVIPVVAAADSDESEASAAVIVEDGSVGVNLLVVEHHG